MKTSLLISWPIGDHIEIKSVFTSASLSWITAKVRIVQFHELTSYLHCSAVTCSVLVLFFISWLLLSVLPIPMT